jgi:hypothetical protein
MGLFDGLRSGQALLNMTQFGSAIQLPDDTRMYQLGMMGAKSGVSAKTPKQQKEAAKKYEYMSNAQYESTLFDNALQDKNDQFTSKWLAQYKKEGGGNPSTFYNKHQLEIENERKDILEASARKTAYHQQELQNKKTYGEIFDDPNSQKFIASKNSDVFSNMFSISAFGSEEKLTQMSSSNYGKIKQLQRKVMQSYDSPTPYKFTKEDKEFLKSSIPKELPLDKEDDNDLQLYLKNLELNPISVFDNMNIQDQIGPYGKPYGQPIDKGGYMTANQQKDVENAYTALVDSIPPISTTIRKGVPNSEEAISGKGFYYSDITSKDNRTEAERKINSYVQRLTTNERAYWNSEYIQAVQGGMGYIDPETKETKYVSDLTQEEFIKERVLSKFKLNYEYKNIPNVQQDSGAFGYNKQNQKSNWWFANLEPQLNADGTRNTNANIKTFTSGEDGSYMDFILKDKGLSLEYNNKKEKLTKDLDSRLNILGITKDSPEYNKRLESLTMKALVNDVKIGKLAYNADWLDDINDGLLWLRDEWNSKDLKNAVHPKQSYSTEQNKAMMINSIENLTKGDNVLTSYLTGQIPPNDAVNMTFVNASMRNRSLKVYGANIDINEDLKGANVTLIPTKTINNLENKKWDGVESNVIDGFFKIEGMTFKEVEEVLKEKGLDEQAIKHLKEKRGFKTIDAKLDGNGNVKVSSYVQLPALTQYDDATYNLDMNYQAEKLRFENPKTETKTTESNLAPSINE